MVDFANEEERKAEARAQDEYLGWRVIDLDSEVIGVTAELVRVIEALIQTMDETLAVRTLGTLGCALLYGSAKMGEQTGKPVVERVE